MSEDAAVPKNLSVDALKGDKIAPTMPQDIRVDLNMAGSDKNTPLHVACSVGNDNVV